MHISQRIILSSYPLLSRLRFIPCDRDNGHFYINVQPEFNYHLSTRRRRLCEHNRDRTTDQQVRIAYKI